MLTIEVPIVKVQMGRVVGFGEQRPPELPKTARVSSIAKDLALGHRILQAVERGEVRDCTDAARRLRVSQARVSMLVALTFLAPSIQEAILRGELWTLRLNIHHLLPVARLMDWSTQSSFLHQPNS